jgi:DNA invertase Pin-like site-specific DNA recombinase
MIQTELAARVGSGLRAQAPAGSGVQKIESHHVERLAVVYVRQSTGQQVLEHRESTALQYGLRDRALSWGWSGERVLVIDEDQGHTGSSAAGRSGFQRLLAEVGLNHVGLILGIEMSRLARCCKDWYQLLELCAVFQTLLADQDGLYDPRQYNDRLLLGLKGTLSEAELHILRQRMSQGRLNKAQRGELFNHPAIGYIRLPSGQIAKDPDEQVQAVVQMIFDQFEQLGSINALLRSLVCNAIRLPIRVLSGPQYGQLQWHRPNRQTLRNLLHHPIYAGAYTWGRRAVDGRRKIPGRPGTGRTVVEPEQCLVFLKDRCPAYISWDQYEKNRRTMTDNQLRTQRRGPAREGASLLAGVLICGHCGCRMMVQYSRHSSGEDAEDSHLHYVCARHAIDYGAARCQRLSGRVLDAFVSERVLRVLEPASLELSLTAVGQIEQERKKIDRHWQQRVERAQYAVDRAARQYHCVEPENRLVARELERQWEQHLLALQQLKEEHARFRAQQPSALTEADRQIIRSMSSHIATVWHATETSHVDRKMIVRHLIERVTVTAPSDTQHVEVTIRWAGGFVSEHRLIRPVARYEQLDNYESLITRVLALKDQKQTCAQIAERLNREGYRPPKRRTTFNAAMVRQLLSRKVRTGKRSRAMESGPLTDHEWWVSDLSRHLQIPKPTLYAWVRRGLIHARKLPGVQGPWIVWADAEEVDRLRRLHNCPRTWWNQPQATDLARPKPRPGTEYEL